MCADEKIEDKKKGKLCLHLEKMEVLEYWTGK